MHVSFSMIVTHASLFTKPRGGRPAAPKTPKPQTAYDSGCVDSPVERSFSEKEGQLGPEFPGKQAHSVCSKTPGPQT